MKMYAALKDSYCCVSFDCDLEVVKEEAERMANNVYDKEVRIYELNDFASFYEVWHHESFDRNPPIYIAKPKRHYEIYRSDLERIYERYIKPHTGYEGEHDPFYEWIDDMKDENVFREVKLEK